MTRTVFALATAPGRAAVAVIRISGPRSSAALATLTAPPPVARLATLRTLRGPGGDPIDRALVLWFPAPASYTGEDCVELHLHGGGAVIDAVSAALLDAGVDLAEAGEFTRRAFENGKLDLDQAEAVADLVDAETHAQARQALGQLRGALGVRYRGWRAGLIDALSSLEAAVDFPDETVPAGLAAKAKAPLEDLLEQITAALEDQARGRRVREGYRIAIIGAPNAGKSRLFNHLVERDAAIVTDIAGTTRDVIEVPMTLSGYRVFVADTAGIRKDAGIIEAEGMRRARTWASSADLRIWMVDQSAGDGAWREAVSMVMRDDICLLNKSDLPAGDDAAIARQAASGVGAQVIEMSLLAPSETLSRTLSVRVARDLTGSDFPAVTRVRHEAHLREGRDHLLRALAETEPELVAENVRMTARALSRIAGEVGSEDVLARIFEQFCIGK